METVLNKGNFDEKVLKSSRPVLVDFWDEWCGPCHAIAPAISEIAKEQEGRLEVGKLNVDEFPEIAQQYLVRSIPNLKLFRGGQVIEELVGAMPKAEIIKRIEKHL